MLQAPCPIFATMILGARREPFLAACLESLRDAVDLVVVDVNGDCPENVADLEASALAAQRRLSYERRAFTTFADARNHALAMLPPGQQGWILRVDADEVHHPELLREVTRGILPGLSALVGMVDFYSLQFMQSLRYYTGMERRHTMMFRRTRRLGYRGKVHEHLGGLGGVRIVLPYVFGHYGYARDPGEVLEKWRLYNKLGDRTYKAEELDRAVGEGYLDAHAAACMAYAGRQPEPVLRMVPEFPHADRFERLVEARGPAPGPDRKHERTRVLWRSAPLWLTLRGEARESLKRLAQALPEVV